MVAMRYFFKVHGLARGGCGLKLSNYALTLIVIMFLQQLAAPLVPLVAQCQAVLAAYPVSGWNCALPRSLDQLHLLPPSPSSPLELLSQPGHGTPGGNGRGLGYYCCSWWRPPWCLDFIDSRLFFRVETVARSWCGAGAG